MQRFECLVEYGDEETAERVYRAVIPDVSRMPARRSDVKLSVVEGNLKISIEAEDVSALRASVSGVLRLISTVERTLGAIGWPKTWSNR